MAMAATPADMNIGSSHVSSDSSKIFYKKNKNSDGTENVHSKGSNQDNNYSSSINKSSIIAKKKGQTNNNEAENFSFSSTSHRLGLGDTMGQPIVQQSVMISTKT